MTNRLGWFCLVFISLVLAGGDVYAQSFKSEAELRKQAEKDFKKQDYAAALPLYSQLLSLNQKDALLNYRYGICLLMADKDKTSAYNYLEFAARDEKTDEDVSYYIARSLQLKYRFDDAINYYKDFAKSVGPGAARKFDVEHQIETCNNAKELMKSRVNVTVKISTEVSMKAIYGAYDIANEVKQPQGMASSLAIAAGKFIATPEKFLSNVDKRRITNPIMFLTADGQTIYYSSYGRDEEKGKDIYVIHKNKVIKVNGVNKVIKDSTNYPNYPNPQMEWGLPQNLGSVVNSKYDEDYPYLNADGKTLYFSSKGHNSMGGYDIFKTTLDANTGEWSEPENLGAGINSPDDDFFYMPTGDGEAQFASAKETAKGMVMIYRIEAASPQRMMVTVHGKYKSLDQLRADGKISVLRKSDKGLVATSRTDQKTGEYEISIPAGDEYEIVVEGGGYMAHVEDFSLPLMDRPATISQEVSMNRNSGVEKLEIRNQYLQSDSASLASASAAKVTTVIKDEYKPDEMNKEKLEPVTINGQVVYATPPSTKKTETNDNNVAPQNQNTSVAADTAAIAQSATGTPSVEENKSGGIDNGVKNEVADNNLNNKADVSTADNEKQNGAITATGAESNKTHLKNKRNKATDNKNPISDSELVKIAFDDAKDVADEAKEIVVEAKTNSAIGSTKDSLSKIQLKQSVEALKAGDEGGAREFTRLSQLNADTAQQARTAAHQLDGKAKMKQAEADRAFADAKELQKNTEKNADGKVAMNESKHKKGVDKKEAGNNETKNEGSITEQQAKDTANVATVGTQQVVSPPDAGALQTGNEVKSSEVQKETVTTKQNVSGSVDLAENKSNVATAEPATSEEAIRRAEELKAESKDFKLQSEALKEQVKKSTDAELNKEWSAQAKSYADSSKMANKEAGKELALAKELKKKEAKNGVQTGEVANAATEKKKDAEQPIALNTVEAKTEGNSVKPFVSNSNAVSPEEPTTNPNNNNVAVEQNNVHASGMANTITSRDNISNGTTPVVTGKHGETKSSVSTSIYNAPDKEITSNSPAAQSEGAQQSETTPAVNEDARTAQFVKSVAPEAVSSYKEYLKTKQESDIEARKSDALQARVEKMPPSPERDQLTQQANDLNLQSIKTWQQAQVKLNDAKQIDPAVDVKLQDAHFADINPVVWESNGVNPVVTKNVDAGSGQPTTSTTAPVVGATGNNEAGNNQVAQVNNVNNQQIHTEAEMEKEKQKDSLISQAVTHRVMAENATDTATEKTELQKTEQLIVESNSPVKAELTNNHTDNQPANTTTNINANEDAKNSTESPVGQVSKESSYEAENNTTAAATNKAAENTSVTGSTQKEVATKSTIREEGSGEVSPESGSSVNTGSAVLDAKTLHVDESYIYTVSPKQVYNSATNPVPMNPQLPEGLVFKVQIGAFRTPLSPESFKNVQPLSGETTRPGWIRYCVGLFRTFEPANLVKMEMRSTGFKDAFVVAYFNGKRISLFDAYSIINRSGSNEKKLYADASQKETNHLSSLNIKASDHPANNDPDAASFFGTSASTANADESLVEYAVQVGVFKSNVVPKKLQPLIPLNAEAYKNSLYRFTTGRFSLRSAADSMRLVAINTGVKDAFVIIYKGGKRGGGSISSIVSNKPTLAAGTSLNSATANNSNAIIYKVQIGAYRSDLSESKLSALKAQCNAELSQTLSASGLHLIYAGSFSDYNAALLLKNDLVAKGMKDVFVNAFSGDTKISIQKALLQSGK